MPQRILNIADVQLQPRPPQFSATGPAAAVFDARMGQIGSVVGAQKLGYSERHPIRQGDIIACPPGGPEAARQYKESDKSD